MKNLILCLAISYLLVGCSTSYNGDLIFVEPSLEDNFEFPYFLFIPKNAIQNEKAYVIIEPNNSGFLDDDLQKHIDKAKRTASNDFYLGSYVAQELKYPILVPVFPRSKSTSKIYTHSLDRDVMLQRDNKLERLDIQLLEMFKDAQSRLMKKNIKTEPQFLLTGFSASGTFANRFSLIHPDKVKAVAAGGVNGLLMLPFDTLNNEALNYPVGTNDLKTLTNRDFAKELFLKTPQFYYMGKLDENDAIPFSDAFSENEREQIYSLLGEQMQPERWNNCMRKYEEMNVNATFRTYDGIGHENSESIKNEITNFFKDVIEKVE